MLRFLMQEFEGTPLLLLLTTCVADEERDARVRRRNRAVSALAEKYGLPVVDLYAMTDAHRNFLSADGVHLTQEGYGMLADELVKRVRELL